MHETVTAKSPSRITREDGSEVWSVRVRVEMPESRLGSGSVVESVTATVLVPGRKVAGENPDEIRRAATVQAVKVISRALEAVRVEATRAAPPDRPFGR